MTTSISSKAFEKKRQRMKDNTVDKNLEWKNGQSELFEQMFSDHKKLKSKEKHFIKNH